MSASNVVSKACYAVDSGLRTTAPPKYSITRGEDDTLQWDPPTGSRELANALSYHYPMENGLQEKMQRAVLDFFEAEIVAGEPSSNQSEQLNGSVNPKAPDSATNTEKAATNSQKPREKSAPSSQKGHGQETRGVWDIRTGESVKSSWRMRPLSPGRRKEVAENRGNACERHRKSKTRVSYRTLCSAHRFSHTLQCDPTRCRDNKLYPGKSINPTSAKSNSDRKRDREDESSQDESQAPLIDSPSTITNCEDRALDTVKGSSSLSLSSSKSATQSGDGQTPSDQEDYNDHHSYLSFEFVGERRPTSFVSYSEDCNPSKRMRFDGDQDLTKDLPNTLIASMIFDNVPGNEMLFPWTMNPIVDLDPSLGIMGQSSCEFRREKICPSVQETFGGAKVDWIEALMASDMPPLDLDWSLNPNADLFSPVNGMYDGQSAVEWESHGLQRAPAPVWPIEPFNEPQVAASVLGTSPFHGGSGGKELFDSCDLSSMDDLLGDDQYLNVSASFDSPEPQEVSPRADEMGIEDTPKEQKASQRKSFKPLVPSSSVGLSIVSQTQEIQILRNAIPSPPLTWTEEEAVSRVSELSDSSQAQLQSYSYAPAGALFRPIAAESAQERAVHAPAPSPLLPPGATSLYPDDKKLPGMRIASADALDTPTKRRNHICLAGFRRKRAALTLTSHRRTYIQDLSALLQESGIRVIALLQQHYPNPLLQKDMPSSIDIIIFGASKDILSPLSGRLQGQLKDRASRVRSFTLPGTPICIASRVFLSISPPHIKYLEPHR